MRFKPVPPNWGNRRLDRRNRLTWALQQARIATRLTLIAYQHQQSSEPHEPSPLLRAYKPLAAAIEAIPNLKSLWQAKSTEDIQIALDNAQSALLQALESDDPRMRMIAACSHCPDRRRTPQDDLAFAPQRRVGRPEVDRLQEVERARLRAGEVVPPVFPREAVHPGVEFFGLHAARRRRVARPPPSRRERRGSPDARATSGAEGLERRPAPASRRA